MIIVYQSLSGNVRRFVKKSGLKSFEINGDNIYDFKKGTKFILVVPTYEQKLLGDVFDFMEDYHDSCLGIVGSGNINFDKLYIFTAKDLSKQYNIPILQDIEYFGTKKDVETFVSIVKKIENGEKH